MGVGGCQLFWKKALQRCKFQRYWRYEGVGGGTISRKKALRNTWMAPYTVTPSVEYFTSPGIDPIWRDLRLIVSHLRKHRKCWVSKLARISKRCSSHWATTPHRKYSRGAINLKNEIVQHILQKRFDLSRWSNGPSGTPSGTMWFQIVVSLNFYRPLYMNVHKFSLFCTFAIYTLATALEQEWLALGFVRLGP